MAVAVGIGQQHDALIAQLARITIRARAAAERDDQVRDLAILQHFAKR